MKGKMRNKFGPAHGPNGAMSLVLPFKAIRWEEKHLVLLIDVGPFSFKKLSKWKWTQTDLCDRWWPELELLLDWVDASGRPCWWCRDERDDDWMRLDEDKPPMEFEWSERSDWFSSRSSTTLLRWCCCCCCDGTWITCCCCCEWPTLFHIWWPAMSLTTDDDPFIIKPPFVYFKKKK